GTQWSVACPAAPAPRAAMQPRRRAALRSRAVSLPDASRASDRKHSTPRHGRLLHPSSWVERDDCGHAADNFFQGGSPKQATPLPRQQLPSPPKIVLRQISGDDAWMKIRNQKVPPTGGPFGGKTK